MLGREGNVLDGKEQESGGDSSSDGLAKENKELADSKAADLA